MGRQHSTASKSGGSLKRSTGLMKLQHMKYVMSWKEDLKAAQLQRAAQRLEEQQADLMDELMTLDLAWEAWYDDDANVPEWGTTAERVQILQRRIAELKTPAPLSLSTATSPQRAEA